MPLTCRSCGNENPYGSAYCNSCGRRVETAPAHPAVRGKTCPRCGAVNPGVASFCQHCAGSFSEAQPHPRQGTAHRPGTRCEWCGASVGPTDRTCASCGGHVSPSLVTDAPETRPSSMPDVAAVLFVGSAILSFFSGLRLLSTDGYLASYGVDFSGMLDVCGTLSIMFGCSALLAALLSHMRTRFTLTVLAAALGIVGLGPFGLGALMALIGMIIVIRERDEFRG